MMTQTQHKVEFKWREKELKFNSWEIAHFRLLGDDRRLPYGTSMLEKCKKNMETIIISGRRYVSL